MSAAETSIQALKKKIEDGSIETDKERCFMIIQKYGPITSEEMERHMGKSKYSFSGRINELKEDDLVEVTGTRDGHQVLETVEQSGVDRSFVSANTDVEINLQEEEDDLFIDDNKNNEKEVLWSAENAA